MVKCIEADLNGPAEAANVVKIHDWASRATLDIIGAAGMDHDFESLRDPDNELNVQYRKMFMEPSKVLRLIALLGFFFDLRVLHKLPLARNRELNEGTRYLRNVTSQIIQRKREKLERKESASSDLISVALASGGFTEENLVDQMMTFLAAGHETTATALCWTVYALCKHRQIQSRLREEIRSNLPPISTENAIVPDPAAIDALPYLNAFCNEVLRFYPAIPLTYREALKDSSVLGTFIPKGTIMVLAADATNHDPSLWGPDAAKFDPERWMGPGRANTGGAESNYASLTFIHGPRSCIGQGFSKSELACLVAALAGRFDMELADPEADLELSVGFTVAPKDGVLARLKVVEGW